LASSADTESNKVATPKPEFLRKLELKPRPSEPVSELHREQLRALIESSRHLVSKLKPSAYPQVKSLLEAALAKMKSNCTMESDSS